MFLSPVDQFLVLPVHFLEGLQPLVLSWGYKFTLCPGTDINSVLFGLLGAGITVVGLLFSNLLLYSPIFAGGVNLSGFSKSPNSETVPTTFLYLNYLLCGVVSSILADNAGYQGLKLTRKVNAIFFIIMCCNIGGLMSVTTTMTAQLCFTLSLALYIFVTFNIICFSVMRTKILRMFVPAYCPFVLLPLLILVESVGFFIRVVSLSVRVFCNVMSGHTLVKILGGFFWLFVTSGSAPAIVFGVAFYAFICVITIFEVFVSFMQAYVFVVMLSVYFYDTFGWSPRI
jgi:F-type H+-transporting ATPase subunit a